MAQDKEGLQSTDAAPAEPNERAFNGHPDHPPMQPDHSPENNRVLLGEGAPPADVPTPEADENDPSGT
jgi:hypothetical protein